jgi:aminomethyltransferase
MGYVDDASSAPGTTVRAVVRGKELAARVVALPFVPHHYYRGP